jgi:hypothetical protein
MKGRLAACIAGLAVANGTALAHTNLSEAYAAMGFNPAAPGNAQVVLFSDPHLCLDPRAGTTPGVITTNLDRRLVDHVNAMDPSPARIIVAGDETTSYSACPGELPDLPEARTQGFNEMRMWLPALQAFTNIAPAHILWIPGNHDQDPREANADLFCYMFPDMPPYQLLDLAGVRFFLLNGGNQNYPSDSESQWLRQQVALTSPTQTVAVVIHQPPFGVNRGNSCLLQECFRNWPDRWWTFCGHAHYFNQVVYDIGRSSVAMSCIGSVNTNQFNGQTMSPGFMVLCLSNGIAGRVYCHFLNDSFEVVPEPEWQNPAHFVPAFGEVNGLLWRRDKFPGPAPPEVIVTNFAYDAGYYYAYVGELQWALPLAQYANKATHFLLSTYIAPGFASVSFSADRTNWMEASLDCLTNCIYFIPIPPEVAGLQTGYARLLSSVWNTNAADNYVDIGVGGWGLATTQAPPWINFPQLAPVADQSVVAGQMLTVTNLAIDPYAPPDVLNFSLLNAPEGATVEPHSGVFRWQALIPNTPTTTHVTVKVSDNGNVPMCATQQFSISVAHVTNPIIASPQWLPGQCRFTVWADTGASYTIWASTNLADWTLLATTNPATQPFQITDTRIADLPCRFYRVAMAP